MDRWTEVTAFVEVARRRSFVRAAEHLEVNVSAVSRAVAALEQRLGVRLLQRTTRQVSLTEVGQAHLLRCEALLGEWLAAETSAAEAGTALHGVLRVAAPPTLGLTDLAPALGGFLRAHPGLQLDIQLSNSAVDLVEEGFDLAIRLGTLRDSRLAARRLGTSHRVLVASLAYAQAHGLPERPADLARHATLVLDIGATPQRWTLHRASRAASVEVQPVLRSNHALALREPCREGVGIALLPHFAVAADLAAGRLLPVLPGWTADAQSLYAVYPSHRFIPAKVRAFVEFLEQQGLAGQ